MSKRSVLIDKNCPDYIDFQCLVCGFLTGIRGPHPPGKGVWVDGKKPAKQTLQENK